MSTREVLLLIGHGSARYPDAGDAMRLVAGSPRIRTRFAGTEIAVLNGAPAVADALSRIGTAAIRVVPFFMEDGYFSRVAVPRALLGRSAAICPPVGIHDGMAGLIERQALAACEDWGIRPRTAAVLVVGHGSSSAPGRALALHRHTARVAATGLFARTGAACLEEPPFVTDMLRGLRAHPVVVIGFFANQGGHVRDDVPALIAAEQIARGGTGPVVRFRGCVTGDPAMDSIILDQAALGPGKN